MKRKSQSLLCAAIMLGSVVSSASALEYHYGADLYDNYFYTPTSSNHALDLESKDDSGGTTIVVPSDSMGGDGEQAVTRDGSPNIPVGSFIDPWGANVENQIETDEELNGLLNVSFNRLSGNTSTGHASASGYGGVFTERSQVAMTNGHFGAVSIGSHGLFAYVYPSASAASMRKGAGHVDGTSAWNGNVVVCGHNRGSWPYFQSLKNVRLGDVITYKTSLGTRTYRVTYSGKIGATDTSVLAPTTGNQITMLTCVANEPSYRYCVVGQEIR